MMKVPPHGFGAKVGAGTRLFDATKAGADRCFLSVAGNWICHHFAVNRDKEGRSQCRSVFAAIFGLRATSIFVTAPGPGDRKSTRLNSSHANISYAVFC